MLVRNPLQIFILRELITRRICVVFLHSVRSLRAPQHFAAKYINYSHVVDASVKPYLTYRCSSSAPPRSDVAPGSRTSAQARRDMTIAQAA